MPSEELENVVVTNTILNYEHLFRIVTPINIDRLSSLLTNHPNQPLVQSVLTGLREGLYSIIHVFSMGFDILHSYSVPGFMNSCHEFTNSGW